MTRVMPSFVAAVLLAVVSAGCLFQNSPAPLVFEPADLPPATIDTAYEATIEIGGNVTPAYQFRVTAGELPPGLTLGIGPAGSDTGVISGVPETAGTWVFTVWVACYGTQVSGQVGSREYTIRVS